MKPRPSTSGMKPEPASDSDGQLISWDADGQPISRRFDDVYFSRHSGIDESRYVFIEHNDLPRRWADLPPQAQFIIGETGFGTGLNFLAAWDLWRSLAPPDACLHFVSVEKYPLPRGDLQRALHLWPQLAHLTELLIQAYPPIPATGFQRLVFDGGRVQLTLILDDAVAGLRQLLPVEHPGPQVEAQNPVWAVAPMTFDAIFLDGFAPAKNPDMWSPALFTTLGRLSRPGTTLATFSAAAIARQGLADAGFAIDKVPGFGRKRHMIRGRFLSATDTGLQARARTDDFDLAWHLARSGNHTPNNRNIVVIGAGLAGCHTARALAERGFQVTVLEKETVASGASGNSQGIVYAKASSQDQPLTTFNLTALQFACRYYQTRTGYRTCGEATGVLHLAQTAKQAAEYRTLAARYGGEPDFIRWLEQEESEQACGLPLSSHGLLFAQAGWLDPRQLCRELLIHPNINCREEQQVARIDFADGHWQALNPNGALLAQAPQLVIANATDALRLKQTSGLPLKSIRGQITEVKATDASRKLRRVVCGKGYIAPARTGVHCLGASFNLGETDSTANVRDDRENLANVADLSPALREWPGINSGRVGFRCTTPDYLPLVGAVPVETRFVEDFAILRRNAKALVDATGSYYPGLYINVGHGSRGLAYTPLCAELLVSVITGAPLPLARDMATRLHPARFLIRDLKRNRL